MMNLMRMREGNFCKIHHEKLETLESFRPKIENETEKFYSISNCRLNIQAKDKLKLRNIQLAL